ncbi:unnamed protein product, partial [marine sediment metagenome]
SMTSLNICIFSHLIYQDKILIKKVKIGKACVVGPHTIVSPGTIMHDFAVLGVNMPPRTFYACTSSPYFLSQKCPLGVEKVCLVT